ncbi:hypothetical protein LCM27_06590 [Ruegeria marisrubri]|uniref:hypothetical protein n=1 Tax=Ruegeria marisrubri TaxID=1685379 RepID=UPI001CD7C502|nr:hypothetical protein [Ruegeria marisrubri]MCA0906062.1 hypothetical protein [Ruegeria marisrubri]
MTDLLDMVWDTDIDLVLNRIQPRTCADPYFFYATVDLIEDGRSPTGTGRLTLSELEAWAERVKKGTKVDVEDQTRIHVPENNDVPDAASRKDNRVIRPVHRASA